MPATVWKGYLTFSLVSFPVRLFAAARPAPVRFHMLHKKDLSRIREVFYCAAEDRPVDRSQIVKGYEYAKDRYVVIEPEDLEKIAPPTASVMEIIQFVRIGEIDPVFFETSYYVAPEEAVSRPYALLFKAMQETGYDALAKVAMHGREHIVILRPAQHAIMLHTMYFVDELNKSNEVQAALSSKIDNKEIDLAKKLIDSLARPFEPQKFYDEYKENVEKMIEKKRTGKKITPVKQPRKAPVIDLMQALRESLAKTGRKATPSRSSASKRTSHKRKTAA